MKTVDAFLSCSFAECDQEVVGVIAALARGMGFVLTNVSTGAPETPPNVAKDKIVSAQCVIAICTKRDELKSGKHIMPQAVQDELGMAFGTDTPFIMLLEEGVEALGFKPNFGTYAAFNRDKLVEKDTLQSLVAALYNLRVSVTGEGGISLQGLAGSYAEWIKHSVELEPEGSDFIWKYSTAKRLIYTQPGRGSFPAGVWATSPGQIPETAPVIEWSVETLDSSNGIKVISDVQEQTSTCVNARLRMEPTPDAHDFVEYFSFARSRYLNPVWLHEATGSPVHLDSATFKCFDGLVFIHRTQKATIEFRFPRSYGLKGTDIKPFVASYTSNIDYEVPSELTRAKINIEEFAGTLVVRLDIENPLPNLYYGIAWDPVAKP